MALIKQIIRIISWVMYYSLILAQNVSDISNFTCEITKLPWQPPVRLSAKMMTESKNFMNEDARTLKDALENLNTGKSTSGRVLTGILPKNSELEPNLSCKVLRSWSS